MSSKEIFVYENWSSPSPKWLGTLYVSFLRGKETYSFEFSKSFLSTDPPFFLDPALSFFPGRQYASDGFLFGAFSDACPDRWGRTLMKRREALAARQQQRKPAALYESDYLLGVFDLGRMGALRFAQSFNGPFLASGDAYAIPPWETLRALEQAARQIEDPAMSLTEDREALSLLLAPGSSLGGARPKATVEAPDHTLWIAKFPAKQDEYDVGLWEMTAHDLAALVELDVPEARLCTFSSNGSTFLVKRFDRAKNYRIHFASAMTMMGRHDNDPNGSYLDLADFIQKYSFSPRAELHQLWKRLAFNMLISNTDDHLRNHGFILADNHWRLSPLYDVNPIPYGNHLSLTVDGNNDMIDLSIALDTAPFYDLPRDDAEKYISWSASIITRSWKKIALHYGAPRKSIEYMKAAFLSAKEAM